MSACCRYPGPTPWRQPGTTKMVSINLSLSNETWDEAWEIASAGERQEAYAQADANPYVRAKDRQFMAMMLVRSVVIQRLTIADLGVEGSMEPVVCWYELERGRRRWSYPSITAMSLSRKQYEFYRCRRGDLTSSEYAAHLLFQALPER